MATSSLQAMLRAAIIAYLMQQLLMLARS